MIGCKKRQQMGQSTKSYWEVYFPNFFLLICNLGRSDISKTIFKIPSIRFQSCPIFVVVHFHVFPLSSKCVLFHQIQEGAYVCWYFATGFIHIWEVPYRQPVFRMSLDMRRTGFEIFTLVETTFRSCILTYEISLDQRLKKANKKLYLN